MLEFIAQTGGGQGKISEKGQFEQNDPHQHGSMSGSFHWDKPEQGTSRQEPAHYLVVKQDTHVQLLKFYAQHVWGLKKPGIVISVTGGAQSMDNLNSEEKEKIFKGMMEGTKGLQPWIVTGGMRLNHVLDYFY